MNTKKPKKQKHEHKKKFLLLNAAEIYRFIQSLNEKKICQIIQNCKV